MGDKLKNKYRNLKSIIIPNKKLNIFIISILVLGLITGSLFASMINNNDKIQVINKVKEFITNINNNSLNSLTVLKNTININLIYILLIIILGLTIIGIFISIIILYLKGFILGFTLSSFIITYKYRGLILSALYLIFGELLNIIIIILITIYSIKTSTYLIKLILKNNNYNKNIFRDFLIISIICIVLSIISSLIETFILPGLIKLVIKLYI